jgi:hypothetical protein
MGGVCQSVWVCEREESSQRWMGTLGGWCVCVGGGCDWVSRVLCGGRQARQHRQGCGEAVFPSVSVLVAVCLSVWEAQASNLGGCCWTSYCSRRLLSSTAFNQPVFSCHLHFPAPCVIVQNVPNHVRLSHDARIFNIVNDM